MFCTSGDVPKSNYTAKQSPVELDFALQLSLLPLLWPPLVCLLPFFLFYSNSCCSFSLCCFGPLRASFVRSVVASLVVSLFPGFFTFCGSWFVCSFFLSFCRASVL